MASSGTITNPTFVFRMKPRDREEVLISGKARIKSSATLEADALELRTIKAFVAMPGRIEGVGLNGIGILQGSVTRAGGTANSVSLRTLRGTPTANTGTVHLGTKAGGTMMFTFFAVGA